MAYDIDLASLPVEEPLGTTCDLCGGACVSQDLPGACVCPCCQICGETDHVEATCPMLVCEKCGQHAEWNKIDHDSNVCHECEPICITCEKQVQDVDRSGRCESCHNLSQRSAE